jgi:hypothetical protein
MLFIFIYSFFYSLLDMKREKETLMNHFSLEECFKFFVQEVKKKKKWIILINLFLF